MEQPWNVPSGPAGAPLPAFCLSTYLSESCYKGRLFDKQTYDFGNFQLFMDRFAEESLNDLRLPKSFRFDTVLSRYQEKLRAWTLDYKRTIESTEPKDPSTLKKAIKRARDEGGDSLDLVVRSLKSEEFPPILWMEFSRARKVFLDSIEFMIKRMGVWFSHAPKYYSQSRSRSKLAKSMAEPFVPLFHAFASSMVEFSRMLLFIEIWSCSSEDEIFSNKRWTLRNVEPQAFEQAYFALNGSISSLRQVYFQIANTRSAPVDVTRPSDWAFKQMVDLVEVS
jgi:hypothetical protein